jgi:hypothetical protein
MIGGIHGLGPCGRGRVAAGKYLAIVASLGGRVASETAHIMIAEPNTIGTTGR